MAIVIFGFSKQNGDESSGISEKIATFLVEQADHMGMITLTDENRAVYVEKLQFPIRKGAHMTEYAVFGMLIFLALTVDGLMLRLRFYMTIFLVFIFACSDEIHQLYVPGRSGKFFDVCIDMLGCLFAMGILRIIILHLKKKKAI